MSGFIVTAMKFNSSPVEVVMSLLRSSLVMVLLLLLGPQVRADLIVAETFNDKTLGSLNGQGGGSGAWGGSTYTSTSAVSVVSGGLSYSNGGVFVDGGTQSLRVTSPSADGILSRQFADQTGPVYFSLLFRPGQAPDIGAAGDFVQFLLNDDSDEANSGSIGMNRAASPDRNPFFSRVGTSGSGDTDLSAILAQNATTYMLVGRFTKSSPAGNYDRMSLWVNPSSLIETLPLVTSNSDSGTSLLDFFSMRTADITTGEFYFIDELRLGDSFDAVVVPEPSTWLACGLMLAGGWLARRRLKAKVA